MSKIRESDLIDLGFQITYVSEEESGDIPYHYYAMDLWQNEHGFVGLCMLSCANDEAVDNAWTIEILEANRTIKDLEILKEFVEICRKID